jgi:hypothetical protein
VQSLQLAYTLFVLADLSLPQQQQQQQQMKSQQHPRLHLPQTALCTAGQLLLLKVVGCCCCCQRRDAAAAAAWRCLRLAWLLSQLLLQQPLQSQTAVA